MNFDDFVFTKQHDSYNQSIIDYLQAVQSDSQYESLHNFKYLTREVYDENDEESELDLTSPDVYVINVHKVHVFSQKDSKHEATYAFTGAGNFLYFISKYTEIDRAVTKMEFLRRMHDNLYNSMGIDEPFIDNRSSRYEMVLKNVDGVIKLFHLLNYDTGFRAVFDQSFNIIDVYFRQATLEKFRDRPLDDKKVIFAFFNVYFRSPLLRDELCKKYDELTFEEIRDYLTIYRMVNI